MNFIHRDMKLYNLLLGEGRKIHKFLFLISAWLKDIENQGKDYIHLIEINWKARYASVNKHLGI